MLLVHVFQVLVSSYSDDTRGWAWRAYPRFSLFMYICICFLCLIYGGGQSNRLHRSGINRGLPLELVAFTCLQK